MFDTASQTKEKSDSAPERRTLTQILESKEAISSDDENTCNKVVLRIPLIIPPKRSRAVTGSRCTLSHIGF